MTIIATAPVPVINRIDTADTHRLSFPAVSPATLALCAALLFATGTPATQVAARLRITEAEAIELHVDHTCARSGAWGMVGLRPPTMPGDLTIAEILRAGDR